MLHLRLSVAPGADALIAARISRSFLRVSLGAPLMYSVTVVGFAVFVVNGPILHSTDHLRSLNEQRTDCISTTR